ncbi:MAG TPA: homoserine dehydrogenase, partial [Gammaproteobacteria bacterium]|nr:homoserine dehydrogenase [Gammaproteobacteria bacterium]
SRLAFEAAVAGAIPIVDALQRSLVANRFRQLLGIINGTCNYMLTTMELEGISFDEVLARAQSLGYAEADPSFDIEGIDAAHKLTILLALAFGARFEFDKIFVEGIAHITADDIRYAAELGYR